MSSSCSRAALVDSLAALAPRDSFREEDGIPHVDFLTR